MGSDLVKKLSEISRLENDKLYLDKHKNPGDLYHYSSSYGVFSIIQDEMIHVTSSGFMNDYSDGKYIRKAIARFCEKNIGNYNDVLLESVKWYFREMTPKDMQNDLSGVRLDKNNNFVFSLTFKKDSQNMWSNYSNNEGYCLKLNYQKLMECFHQAMSLYEEKYDCSIGFTCGKVIYSETEQEEILNNIFKKIHTEWVNYGAKCEDVHIATLEFIASTIGYFDLFKDPLFAEEDEYRIIVTLFNSEKESNSQDIIKYKPKIGIIVPYIEIPIKSNYGISPIELIRIGPKNNIDVAEEGVRLFLESKKFENTVGVIRSEMTLRF